MEQLQRVEEVLARDNTGIEPREARATRVGALARPNRRCQHKGDRAVVRERPARPHTVGVDARSPPAARCWLLRPVFPLVRPPPPHLPWSPPAAPSGAGNRRPCSMAWLIAFLP